MKKILLVTEFFNAPYDEGIKKTAFNLYHALSKSNDVHVICRHGEPGEDITVVQTNSLFLSVAVYRKIKKFKPDVLIYFSFASATFAGYLRLKVLRLLAQESKPIFIALQFKRLSGWQEYLLPFLKPTIGLTPSAELKNFWDRYRINSQLLPLLTDLSLFTPLPSGKSKAELRRKYGIPENSFVVSHIGHLNAGRNLEVLLPLQQAGMQVVVVGSSSTPEDAVGPGPIKKELEKNHVIVLDSYIENIQEIYHLSDVYIFPVVSERGSIGMPLSILEARSCGVPVLTVDYGSVKQFLGDDFGGIYYTHPDNFLEAIKDIPDNRHEDFTKSSVPQLNQQFYKIIRQSIEQ